MPSPHRVLEKNPGSPGPDVIGARLGVAAARAATSGRPTRLFVYDGSVKRLAFGVAVLQALGGLALTKCSGSPTSATAGDGANDDGGPSDDAGPDVLNVVPPVDDADTPIRPPGEAGADADGGPG